jgi:Uncharacterised nucleotidyltransferase
MQTIELNTGAPLARAWPEPADLWGAVDRIVELAANDADVLDHRLATFAARRRRLRGADVPEEFARIERAAALAALTAPLTLDRVRAAVTGELLVLKGPEVAARYPDRALRAYGDLDLLPRDPSATHEALRAAGATPVGDPTLFVGIHHLRPLAWPDLPLVIEIHSRPKWVDQLPPLPVDDVFRTAGPAAVEADGYLAPSAEAHAVLLGVHSWAHEPLRRIRDMVDIAALLEEADRERAGALARDWGVGRLWRSTEGVVDALFFGGPTTPAMRLWAQNLARVQGRTVLENHLQRWLSDFSIMSPHRAAARLPGTLVSEVRPDRGEPWPQKLRRTGLALKNALRRRFEHDDEFRRLRRR